MQRRDFLQYLLGTGLLAPASLAQPRKTAKRKNLILVTLDTTRKDHLGLYGYPRKTSPNLDAFAEESLVFEDCYSTSCYTLPSHASLFTGLHPYAHGAITNKRKLDERIPTLGSCLESIGYQCCAITSVWFLSKEIIGNGFQRIDSPQEMERGASEAVAKAIREIDCMAKGTAPFFLWLHLFDPHFQYAPPPDFEGKFSQKSMTPRLEKILKDPTLNMGEMTQKLQDLQLSEAEQAFLIDRYDEEIAAMDSQIGLFLAELKERGLYQNSIITFIADHGESLFENSAQWASHDFLYEPTLQIPFILRHPDYEAKRVPGLIQNIDVAPTLLKFLKATAPKQLDGKESSRLIEGAASPRSTLYATGKSGRALSLRDERYKLIVYTSRKRPLPTPQEWIDELALPRLHFLGEIPGGLAFADGPTTTYQWSAPEPEKVARYVMQILNEKVFSPDHVRTNPEIPEITPQGGKLTLPKGSILAWNRRARLMPTKVRIIAKDHQDKTIASSEVLTIDMDSPLGNAPRLFDLKKDPHEKHDLSTTQPERLRVMRERLQHYAQASETTIVHGGQALRDSATKSDLGLAPEHLEAIESLGYLD